jgi:hypothetical protein
MPSRRAGELFLAILEQKGLTIGGAVLDEAGADQLCETARNALRG